ncbi:MAG: hypothetical protein LBL33_00965 [Tannerella sp.]|jgi:hypothetical protein|nr:hypothetical protein [Tannerella sp.]
MLEKIPTLSFCIVYQGQMEQIRQTLGKNLTDNERHKDIIEFVLFDCKPSDHLLEWILADFYEAVNSGYLCYYSCGFDIDCNLQTAKNTACFYSKNDIVTYCGCGDFTGYLGGKYIISRFINFPRIVLQQLKNKYDIGTERISVLRQYFDIVGGYDEEFISDCHVEDLMIRLNFAGIHHVQCGEQNYNQSLAIEKDTFAEIQYIDSYQEGSKRSQEKIFEGRIVANNGGLYGLRSGILNHKSENHH